MSAPENQVLRELLLHRLGEADAHALEERLMTEDGFLEALQDAENDLLDDYASGQLSDADRADVERHLLATPEARQRLEVGRALGRARATAADSSQRGEHADASVAARSPERSNVSRAVRPPDSASSHPPGHARARPRPRRTWQLAALAAAACVALVAFLVPFRFSTVDPNKTMELLLLAENSRSATARAIDIDTSAAAVALQLEVPRASPTAVYGVEILDGTGRRAHEAHGLRAQDVSGYSVVELSVPGTVFQSGPHTIVLRESQPTDPTTPAAEAFRWQININRR